MLRRIVLAMCLLPSCSPVPRLRFEAVFYLAQVWLNGELEILDGHHN